MSAADASGYGRDGSPCCVLGVSAPSGTGKTTFLCRLLPALKASGVRVGVIKRAHHDFEIDYPGKDSYEIRKAGADQVLIASRLRRAVVTEMPGDRDPTIAELISALDLENLDLVLAEGFGLDGIPRIVIHREAAAPLDRNTLAPEVVAVVTDSIGDPAADVPQIALDDTAAACRFVLSYMQTMTDRNHQ